MNFLEIRPSGSMFACDAKQRSCGRIFLAHRIRMSEIVLWDRNSYPTHVILHRLSREAFSLVALVDRQIYSKMTGTISDCSLMQVVLL